MTLQKMVLQVGGLHWAIRVGDHKGSAEPDGGADGSGERRLPDRHGHV